MSGSKPRLSVGLPVFNGEKYLKEALESILAQTYSDFELLISDNASTDHTQHICREYAAKDSRIRYYRNEKNIGAPKNFNRVFELSSCEYFKWAAADDVHAPTYLQKCVSVLDTDPSIILCCSKVRRIDERGRLGENYDRPIAARISSWKPHERFGEFITMRTPCLALFGVIRASVLRKTPLQANYIGADRNLLAEIALMGRIYEIPEYLFFGRDHAEQYTRKFYGEKFAANIYGKREQLAWWNQDEWFTFPSLKICSEYFRSLRSVQLKWSEKLLCYNQMFKWFVDEEGLSVENDLENLLMSRSLYGRKLILATKLNLKRTVIPIIKKMRH